MATLRDVHGGDGNVRILKVETKRLSRTRKTRKESNTIGSPLDRSVKEQQTELKDEPVHTFQRDADGTPLLRLGGPSGKLIGAIKEADKFLRMFGDEGKSKLPIQFVRVSPVYVRLEDAQDERTVGIAQMMNTFGNSMIVLQFDVIGSARVRFTIEYPDAVGDRMRKILEALPTMAIGNKRRSTIQFDSVKEL